MCSSDLSFVLTDLFPHPKNIAPFLCQFRSEAESRDDQHTDGPVKAQDAIWSFKKYLQCRPILALMFPLYKKTLWLAKSLRSRLILQLPDRSCPPM